MNLYIIIGAIVGAVVMTVLNPMFNPRIRCWIPGHQYPLKPFLSSSESDRFYCGRCKRMVIE